MERRAKHQQLEGFLCIDKPRDSTSRDVVNALQRLVRPAKIGHGGTLDPLATGVLVIAIGRATKLIQFVQQMQKEYLGTFELGKTSDTEDVTGAITVIPVKQPPSIDEIRASLRAFVGEIIQRPPKYSALKVDGQRAYVLARQGKEFDLKPRSIIVHDIEVTEYEYPKLTLRILCGSGTYIRSIGRDLGEVMGCGALMTDLVRTRIGKFDLKTASSVRELDEPKKLEMALEPLALGVAELPQIKVDELQLQAISYGQKLNIQSAEERLSAIGPDGSLVSVLSRTTAGDYRPAVNLIAK